jgi:hypothetical protein
MDRPISFAETDESEERVTNWVTTQYNPASNYSLAPISQHSYPALRAESPLLGFPDANTDYAPSPDPLFFPSPGFTRDLPGMTKSAKPAPARSDAPTSRPALTEIYEDRDWDVEDARIKVSL